MGWKFTPLLKSRSCSDHAGIQRCVYSCPGDETEVSTQNAFTLCDYFDDAGRRVERLYLVNEPGDAATERVRELVRSTKLEKLFDAMMAESKANDVTTNLEDAALALHALLHEVADERLHIYEASKIVSLSINFAKAVSVADAMPALEIQFGGRAVSWARGIFRHLNLGSPRIN